MSRGAQGLDRFMALGSFAEHVVVPASMAVPVAGEHPAASLCLIGCGVMTGFGAAAKTAAVGWGETVAVLGLGGVGLAALQGARLAGASRIFAVDPIAERRRVAQELGATDALDPEGAAALLQEATGGGVDVAIECVGSTATMREAFDMLRAGGRAVVAGLASFADVVEIPAVSLLLEKTIKGSVYGSADPARDFPMLVSLYEQGRLDLDRLVGKVRPFEEINEGIADMRRGSVTRVVLTF
jgi:S-(hydroxymethyl)glutathione dehydrogenase/alcohol dehydrogenase